MQGRRAARDVDNPQTNADREGAASRRFVAEREREREREKERKGERERRVAEDAVEVDQYQK
mgnify:CR=1 FL=1